MAKYKRILEEVDAIFVTKNNRKQVIEFMGISKDDPVFPITAIGESFKRGGLNMYLVKYNNNINRMEMADKEVFELKFKEITK